MPTCHEYFDGRAVQRPMTTRSTMQLLEYLEEMRALSRPVKQVKLTTEELAYLVALCNEDVFGRTPTQGKGGPAETDDNQAVNSSWAGHHTLEGAPSTPTAKETL